uniref:DNA polymerase epsilon subunit 3 n=1 Tax=Ixodes ricinus TaxID=34613 RepID=V5HH94_IXORI
MAERPEDLHLPVSVVTRIVKDALPDGVNVSKEARVALSKAASVFVLYATSCANNFAVKSKRKNGDRSGHNLGHGGDGVRHAGQPAHCLPGASSGRARPRRTPPPRPRSPRPTRRTPGRPVMRR